MLNKKALAASVSAPPSPFIEDVFSTYLYTGNGSTQTITNDIDLDGEGGLTWIKSRSASTDNQLFDTVRGATNELISNSNAAQAADADTLTAFNADGFSLGADSNTNTNAATYCSWSFRKQPKFFDVVTYTGTGSARTIAHNLGSTPGMIIVKRTNTTGSWFVYHRGTNGGVNPQNYYTTLESTAAQIPATSAWNDTAPTSTVFSVGTTSGVNASGSTYVAYLFAHDAGGFGEAGTDNVISCGSFTTDSGGNGSANLGYEPQWVMIKRSNSTGNWLLMDNMRGMPVTANSSTTTGGRLYPNSSTADDGFPSVIANATGFTTVPGTVATSATYIYMAIRRPMKVPTTGTEVFSPTYVPTISTGTKSTTGFPIDLQIFSYTTGTTENQTFADRLRGVSTNATEGGRYLISSSTAAEATSPAPTRFFDNTGFQQHSYFSGGAARYWNFRRAPNFFDVVCYTGTGSARTVTHNLGVAPELMIVKMRSATEDWRVYSATIGNTRAMRINDIGGQSSPNIIFWNNTSPTASTFTVGTEPSVNSSGSTYVAYLFSTLAGVSKVGSYTGNGGTQAIACGFTGGARFVMVKATSTTGDWVVVDTARGLVSGDDPFLQLNSTAAEVTGEDILDPDSSGFVVNETTESINASGVSYIFLAIA
jgi:hypothetical protein